jgi:hypothetical protein
MTKLIQNKKVIVVLGMHRSGTSVITRGLQVLGVSLGNNLMPALESVNPKGFWEDLDITSINIELLESLGHTWSSISIIHHQEFNNDFLVDLRKKAKNTLLKKIENVQFFGFKDPRTVKLLPFWQSIFRDLELEVSYVVAIRNPLSVALSLAKRDGFDNERSFYLCFSHLASALILTEGYSRVFVDYDLMIKNPEIQLNRMAEGLGLYFDKFSEEFIQFSKTFLDDSLRHTQFSIDDLKNTLNAPDELIKIFRLAQSFSIDGLSSDNLCQPDQILMRLQNLLINLQPSFHLLDRQYGELSALSREVIELDSQMISLSQTLLEQDKQITNLNQTLLEQDKQIANLKYVLEAVYLSTSWCVTKPLRKISRWWQLLMRINMIYLAYRRSHLGLIGLKRLFNKCINQIAKIGLKVYWSKLPLFERLTNIHDVLPGALDRKYDASEINLLYEDIKKNLIVSPTIIFDHNGGGGSNTYSREIAKTIQANSKSILRVYCFDAIWFIQWIDGGKLFYTNSIDDLFDVLSVSEGTNLIINSIYGFPDIELTASKIVTLNRALSANLDFKIHDFYALCPSPHLSDFEEKYCGVPQDVDVCASCLKKNLNWYHSWFPKEKIPLDIIKWRNTFINLFKESSVVTFFDQSSVEIVRKAFYLDDSLVKVIPHVTSYFKCDQFVDLKGALHIGILGTLSNIKGGKVVKKLYDYIDERNLRVPITVVGTSNSQLPPEIKIHGHYMPDDLPSILSSKGVNVILMPSIIPETFSYTISEAIKMGLPIVAFDLGAQGNRVKQYPLGKVLPLGSSPEVILIAIQSVLKIAQELRS